MVSGLFSHAPCTLGSGGVFAVLCAPHCYLQTFYWFNFLFKIIQKPNTCFSWGSCHLGKLFRLPLQNCHLPEFQSLLLSHFRTLTLDSQSSFKMTLNLIILFVQKSHALHLFPDFSSNWHSGPLKSVPVSTVPCDHPNPGWLNSLLLFGFLLSWPSQTPRPLVTPWTLSASIISLPPDANFKLPHFWPQQPILPAGLFWPTPIAAKGLP